MTDTPRSDNQQPDNARHPAVTRRMLAVAAAAVLATSCGTSRNPFVESTVAEMWNEPILARRPGETELLSKEVTKGSNQLGVRNKGPAVERISSSPRSINEVVDELYQQYGALYNLKRSDLTRAGATTPVVVELRGSSPPDRAIIVVASPEPFNPTVANRDELGRIPNDAKTIVDVAVTIKQPKKRTER